MNVQPSVPKVSGPLKLLPRAHALFGSGLSVSILRQVAAWNSLIPKHAVRVELQDDGGARYLHATKGWRTLSRQRLAMVGIQA